MQEFLQNFPLDVLVLSTTTFFAVVGPIDVGVVFGALTGKQTNHQKRKTALTGVGVATFILLLFCLFGQAILANFGISISALRISGGILLLLVSIKMVFVEESTATSTTKDEFEEAKTKVDISVFPLAIPLIAGPAAIGAAILLMAQYEDNIAEQIAVVSGLLIILIGTLFCMLLASQMQKFLGVTGINVIQRIFGVLLSALAVQFVIDGLMQSKFFLNQ